MKRKVLSRIVPLLLIALLLDALLLPARAYTESDWVLASSAPSGAEITARKWTYTKTSYDRDSREPSKSGWTCIETRWVESGSGSTNYASFPSGFDTGHSIYTSFTKSASCPYSAYENTTNKRTVSDNWGGYVYWHWTYNVTYHRVTNRPISSKWGYQNIGDGTNYNFKEFYAMTSTVNCPYLDNYYCCNQNIAGYNCNDIITVQNGTYVYGLGSNRFFRFEYRSASYKDYYKLFTYQKTENLESSSEISPSSSSSVVISNVKAYVKYKSKFTVSYNANNGQNAPASQTKEFGKTLKLSSQEPYRTGYSFLGWSESSSATTATYAPGADFTANKDVTLYAVWKRIVYTVTYDCKTNGGSSSSASSLSVYAGDNANLSVTATKSGWQHVGWNTDRNATAKLSSYQPSGNVTLYAIFSKTLTAKLYIETNKLSSSLSKTIYNNSSSAEITLPSIAGYDGWTPVGWAQSIGGTEYAAGKPVTISGDANYYAKYKKTITWNFNANGGSVTTSSHTETVYHLADGSETRPSYKPPIPTRDGYEFLGWTTNPSSSNVEYQPGTAISEVRDVTFYALWKAIAVYQVTYDYQTNGGTSGPASPASLYIGSYANLSVTAQKDGWSFVGWNTNKDATTKLDSLQVTNNVTLYAIFSKTVTANLYTGANTLYAAPSKIIYNRAADAEVALPAIPAYNGWESVCWVQKGIDADRAAGSTVTIGGNTDFCAKYVKTFALSYNANGGSTTPPTQSVARYYLADGTYQQTKPRLADPIAQYGFSFDKWAYGGVNGTKYAAGDTISVTEDVTMYATWMALPAQTAPTIKATNAIGGVTVKILPAEKGATVYYTTDGSSPSTGSSVYSGPITFRSEGEYTIKAFSVLNGYTDSPVAKQDVRVSRAEPPKSNHESGYVRADAAITLSTDTLGCLIYYTLDGTTPTTESQRYEGAFFLNGDCTLKAIAVGSGCAESACATYHYIEAPFYATDTHGYSFVNEAASFGYTNTQPSFLQYCIPYSSAELIFGDSVKGKNAYISMAQYAWAGNCCGMTSTSALFFSTDTDISPVQFGRKTVNELRCSDRSLQDGGLTVRAFIEAMQIAQYSVQFDRDYNRNSVSNAQLREGGSLNRLVDPVRADLVNNKPDLIAIGKRGRGAHALLAYDLRTVSSEENRLYVYDCNHPNDPDRYVTLWRDATGRYTGWSYDMGQYGVWGSEESGECYISYVAFDTLQFIWEQRGRLYDNYLTLSVASENAMIHNLEGELVGEFTDGEFHTTMDNVFAIPNLSLSAADDLGVYLPEDVYVVTNLDGGEFEAKMVGESIGATVTTNANAVCFEVNEAHRLNAVSVEHAGAGCNYTVSLDSSFIRTDNTAEFKNETISGYGVGDTMRLSSTASGALNIQNFEVYSYKVNGVEQVKHTITASAGSGGTISPKGDVLVPAGANQTFTMIPNFGYKVKDVIVDGYSIGSEREFTFEAVGKSHLIRVTFEKAFAVNKIALNGNELTVDLMNDSPATLCAAVYTAEGQMVAAHLSEVPRNAATVRLPLDIELPPRCEIKVLLLSGQDAVPLCESKSYFPR